MFDITWSSSSNVGNNEIPPGRNQAHPLVQLGIPRISRSSFRAYATVTPDRDRHGGVRSPQEWQQPGDGFMYVCAPPALRWPSTASRHARMMMEALCMVGQDRRRHDHPGRRRRKHRECRPVALGLVVLDGTAVRPRSRTAGSSTVRFCRSATATQGDSAQGPHRRRPRRSPWAPPTSLGLDRQDHPGRPSSQAFPSPVPAARAVVIYSTGQYQMSPPPARTKCRPITLTPPVLQTVTGGTCSGPHARRHRPLLRAVQWPAPRPSPPR